MKRRNAHHYGGNIDSFGWTREEGCLGWSMVSPTRLARWVAIEAVSGSSDVHRRGVGSSSRKSLGPVLILLPLRDLG